MPVPRRDPRWIWAGRITAVVILAGLTGYLAWAGLDTAGKVASSISVVIALAALLTPYLLPVPQPGGPPMPNRDYVEDTGAATATAGGQANTGLQTTRRTGPAQVSRSGDARADGRGSIASTGIQHYPGPNP
jgi:hypothetical protein